MSGETLPGFKAAAAALAAAGRRFYSRNWVLGTSGNFSAVIGRRPLALCITRSAAHKGTLTAADRPGGGACFTLTLPGGAARPKDEG